MSSKLGTILKQEFTPVQLRTASGSFTTIDPALHSRMDREAKRISALIGQAQDATSWWRNSMYPPTKDEVEQLRAKLQAALKAVDALDQLLP